MVTMPLVAGITGRGGAFGHSGAWGIALIVIVIVS